jgi:hypothetical protein
MYAEHIARLGECSTSYTELLCCNTSIQIVSIQNTTTLNFLVSQGQDAIKEISALVALELQLPAGGTRTDIVSFKYNLTKNAERI